nr:AMP-binding protein [uncultured Desulfobacter sp.]
MLDHRTEMLPLEVTGIIHKNSIDYIKQFFLSYENNKIVVPLKNIDFAKKSSNLDFEDIIEPETSGGWYTQTQKLLFTDNIAQISFTSGTEGEPKGIILTHANLSDVICRLNNIMQIDDTIREYVGIPVYHSFGFGRVRACMSVGGQVFIPQNGFNPLEIVEMLKADKINAISAVPTLWRIILNNPAIIGKYGKKIRWIEIGSQYMARKEKEELKKIFPGAVIVQHYGLTEASRSSFLNITETCGEALESVGKALDGVEIAVNDRGVIAVKGTHVAQSKLSSDGIVSLVNSQKWFVTSDKGYIKDDYLYFSGRADDVINCGGIKISPDFVESELAESTGISRGVSVTKVSDPIRGNGILVVCESHLSSRLEEIKSQIKSILNTMNVQAGDALYFETVDKLPSTDTGKIQRKSLTQNFEDKNNLKNNKIRIIKRNDKDKNDKIVDICKKYLDIDNIETSDSFISLGGDSLLFVVLSIEIENYLGYLPENWEAIPFEQLEKLKNSSNQESVVLNPKTKFIYTIIFMIAILIAGELFLQTRSQIKTGRSAFNIIEDESTTVVNKDLNVKTYRPFKKIIDKKSGAVKMEINSYGLRSPDIPLEPEKNELRIAVVGASTVAGAYAANNDETFPQLLAAKLATVHKGKVNVINGGVEGLTLDKISILTQGLIYRMKPSMIIIYVGFNDITTICKRAEKVPSNEYKLPTIKLPNWIMSADMIKKNTVFLRTQKTKNVNFVDASTVDPSGYKEQLDYLVSDIIQQGIVPVLVTNARSYNNVPDDQKAELAAMSLYFYYCLDLEGIIEVGHMYNDQIRSVARKHKIPLVDVAKIMPGGTEYFVDGGHFTLKGEKFVAESIFKTIISNN